MPLVESLVGPLASLLDKLIPDKEARAKAKLELLALEGTQELRVIETRLSAILAAPHHTALPSPTLLPRASAPLFAPLTRVRARFRLCARPTRAAAA